MSSKILNRFTLQLLLLAMGEAEEAANKINFPHLKMAGFENNKQDGESIIISKQLKEKLTERIYPDCLTYRFRRHLSWLLPRLVAR
jgi:hypothetical protein